MRRGRNGDMEKIKNGESYEDLQGRLAYMERLMDMLSRIDHSTDSGEMGKVLNQLLEEMGKYTGADRVFVFDRMDREEIFSNTFEWCANGVQPQQGNLQLLRAEEMPRWREILGRGEVVVIRRLEDVRQTMPQEYDMLKVQGIESEIAGPIFYRGYLSGFIGLDNPAPEQTELFAQLLRLVGGHLGGARESQRIVDLLEQKQEALRQSLREMEKEQEILNALCWEYTSVYRADLLTDSAVPLKLGGGSNASRFIPMNQKEPLCFTEEMRIYYDRFVVKSTAPHFLEENQPQRLMEALSRQERVVRRFQTVPNETGHRYFEMQVTTMGGAGNGAFPVLVGFRHVDDIAREERQHQKELETALTVANDNNEIISAIGKIYFLIYRIDLRRDVMEEVKVDSRGHRLSVQQDKASRLMARLAREVSSAEYRRRVEQYFDLSTLAERLEKEDTISGEYLAADGNWHLARFIVQKRDEAGQAVQVLYATRLSTEEKRKERYWISAAEEAQRASEAKSEFLSRMSHDIRTPMNAIRGFITIAQQHLDEPAKLRECLEKAQRSGENLQQLIDDILDLSRIESGEFKIIAQPVDLQEQFNLYEETLTGMAAGKNLQLQCSIHDIKSPVVLADPLRLGQVYTNLLSNAVKYTPEGGTVRFEMYQQQAADKDRVRLVAVVSDTGIGMAPEFMEQMYSEFTRAVDTRVNQVRGSGLGLAIVKRIVDLMGGTIEAKSQMKKGTAFWVTLELPRAGEAPARTDRDKPGEVKLPERQLTLLVAEDNDLNYEIEAEMLEMYGIHCQRAKNGEDAVQKFRVSLPGTYDAILMDMQMPVLGGPEASWRIRRLQREDAKTIPIIAVTANAYDEDVRQCKAAGMNDHLAKPFRMEKLVKMVAKYINQNEEDKKA